jgi:hypothetical protein
MAIEQIVIGFTGTVAVWLTQDKREHFRKYASVVGLIGQPFWFYASYSSEMWGIFFLSFLYTYAWSRGFYFNWIEKNHELTK